MRRRRRTEKPENPARTKARAERERTALKLEILCKGIGHALTTGYYRTCEDLQPIIDEVNGPLFEAMMEAQRAEDAYRPYWSRVRAIRPKKTKAA